MALADNLLGYWKLDGNSNDPVAGINGTDTDITYAAGKINDGAGFNGSSSRINLGTGLGASNGFSISMWVKSTTLAGNGMLFGKSDSVSVSTDSYYLYAERINNNTIRINTFAGNGSSGGSNNRFWASSNTIDITNLTHIVLTYDRTNFRVYVNGSLDDTSGSLTLTSINTAASRVNIGAYGQTPSLFFQGSIDEVGLWSRAITGTEVGELYNSNAGLQYPFVPVSKFTLTVNASLVTGSHSNSPVHVDLAEMPADFWSEVTNGGGDIRCYSDSGMSTQIPREVVACDTGTDTGQLHVKVPSLTTSSVIYVTVDGVSTEPAANSTYGSEAVWSAYATMWHMGDLTTSSIKDSSANANTGTKVGTNNPPQVAGVIGNAQDFNGTTSEISRTSTSSLALTGAFAIGGFLRIDGNNKFQFAVAKVNPPGTQNGYFLLVTNTNLARFEIWNSSSAVSVDTTGNALSIGTTYFVVGVFDGSQIRILLNGVQIGSAVNAALGSGSQTLYLGRDSRSAANYFDGMLDEMFIINGAISNDWVLTQYNNLTNPATFWTITGDGVDYNLNLDETVTLVASVAKMPSRVLKDATTIVATFTSKATKYLFDTVALVATATSMRVQTTTLTDVIALVDSVYKQASRTLLDTVVIATTFAQQLVLFRVYNDTVTLGDTISKMPGKVLQNAVALRDILYRTPGKLMRDVVTLGDTFARSVNRLFTDTVVLVDTVVEQVTKIRSFTEAISLTAHFVASFVGYVRRIPFISGARKEEGHMGNRRDEGSTGTRFD
jgi:hypothetical protein